MDIKTLTIEQLKSMVYDQLVTVETAQSNIKLLNQEIANRSKPEQLDEKLPTDSKTVKN